MNHLKSAAALGAVLLTLAACGTPAADTVATEAPAVISTVMDVPTEAAATMAPAQNAPPAVQVVALQEGSVFMVGQEVGVAVLAADSDGIKSAGLTIDGTVVATLAGTPGPIFQGTLLWTPTEPGQFNAAVIVYDNTGGVADFKARKVTVLPAGTPPAGATPIPATAASTGDTAPPAVSITPMETEVTAGSDLDVATNAVDSVGVVKLELYVDGTVVDSWDYDPSTGAAPVSAFETLTWRDSKEGEHEVYVTATDAAGNVGQSVTDKVTVNS